MNGITVNVVSSTLAKTEPVGLPKQSHQPADEHREPCSDCPAPTVAYKYPGRSTCAQVVVVLILNLAYLENGMDVGMAALVLGSLHKNSAERLNMDDAEASWYASLPTLVRPVGSLASGVFQEYFGRKTSAILVNIPMFAAWLILHFADSKYAFYASSIIMGLCCGLFDAPTHSYVGEMAEPRLRGTLCATFGCGVHLGVLSIFIIGNFVEWRTAALIGSAVPVIAFVIMTRIPESPTWLIRRGCIEDAQKSLSWLRGWVAPEKVQDEFDVLVKYVRTNTQSRTIEANSTGT